FYDRGWQYTVPYTIYTTGISWRKDLVSENPYTMKNPWSLLWNPKYKGKTAILDDYRESISLGLMKNGIYDLNTPDRGQITQSRRALEELTSAVNVRIDNNDYTDVPTAETWIHHAWSGDMATAAYYMPKGVSVDTVGYWFPADGRGPVANDTHLVLAREFLNSFLDLPNVLNNISFNGYMQPLTGVTPQVLVKEQILPKTLLSTVVLPSYFRRGVAELQLPVDADALWQQAWIVGSNGIQAVPMTTPTQPAAPSPAAPSRRRPARGRNLFWIALAAPGMIWLVLLFIVPFYAALAIGMGQLDRLFETPIAVWNPFGWSLANVINVGKDIAGGTSFAGPIIVRTIIYVAVASLLCLLIGYPAAYFVARFAGRRKGMFLLLLIAPFWIS